MRVLALQLKRIGDLVLTAPALAALKAGRPEAHVTLGVDAATASLLPCIPHLDAAIVFGSGRGWAPWQQVLTGHFSHVLDFSGTDRSALAAWLSRAPRRLGYAWTLGKGLRARAYHSHIESSVRDRHTITHYCDLLEGLALEVSEPPLVLRVPDEAARRARSAAPGPPYALIHPGTARPEKYWLPDRWRAVIDHLGRAHGLRCIVTSTRVPVELSHAQAILGPSEGSAPALVLPADLGEFAALLRDAALVVSCDTAAVHLAAAFQRPQIALFGPTNPFHWRPRHERARVLSAEKPEAPLETFDPRMKGAPMERISTAAVCAAIDSLLGSARE